MSDTNIDDPFNRRFYQSPKKTLKSDIRDISENAKNQLKNLKNDMKKKSFYKNFLFKRIPIIQWLFLKYNFKSDFLGDIIAGFTVGIMTLPQSMAYALLANLAPVNGLYISFFPVLFYAIFGTSKQISIGNL